LNKKMTTINALIVVLVLAVFSQLVPPQVYADVKIISISPTTKTGKVGESITLIGTINTTNGMYEVLFNNTKVAWGYATENSVNCPFVIPPLPGGNYTVILRDVNARIDSPPSWFYIETAYTIKVDKPPYPTQFQQGMTTINITISVTGGVKAIHVANITVKTPANETYWSLTSINITNTGMGNTTLHYPENFGGAHTNYTGTYTVYFNQTLAHDTFFIGLTDRTEYHRGDTVKIKAVDYWAFNGNNVTITIKFKDKTIHNGTCQVSNGIVEYDWRVPDSAFVGNYSLSITPKPTAKKINDTQVFSVPGFKTEIVSCNLAGEPVSNVLIKVYDRRVNETYDIVSNGSGVATKWLERGEYNATAYFKRVKVGVSDFNITDKGIRLNLPCQLTNLNITVVSQQNMALKIPFVELNLTITYTTELDGKESKTEKTTSRTDVNGVAQLKSLLINATYKIAASRYGRTFNFNNDTVAGLEFVPWNNITIVCPALNLEVKVVDRNNTPIPGDALVEIQEVMGGLNDTKYTNQTGCVIFNRVFGVYNIKVSSGGVLLNATTVELFEGKTLTIYCVLYKLPIYVKVVDYFGQSIPNANVVLERNGVQINSKQTGANGIANFTENGGTLTIKVYLANQNQPAASLTCSVVNAINEVNPIEVKLAKYVVLASFLVETAWFATAVLIVAAIVLFTVVEVVRRRRTKV
jgi:hypothetical protein